MTSCSSHAHQGIVAKGATDFANDDVEVGLDDVGIAPDGSQQFGLRNHIRPPDQQRAQQVERLWRKTDIFAVFHELTRVGIEHEVAKCDLWRFFRQSLRPVVQVSAMLCPLPW